jgi:3-oxocholest-4-en-26-oate---CoA ligase
MGTTAWDLNWSTVWDRIAERQPDAPAIVTPDGSRSYRELEDRASRLAAWLRGAGVRRGSPVGLFLYNRPEYLEAIYAAFKLGAVPVNMNFRYRARELADLVRICGCGVLVYPGSLAAPVTGALELAGERPVPIEVDDGTGGATGAVPYESTLGERLAERPELGGDDRIYLFTGGTTGVPKAVVWTHGGLFDAQLVSLYGAVGVPMPATLDDVVAIATDGRVPAPRTLPITPLMHATAMFNSMNTLTLGGAVVFLGSARFDPAQVLRTVAEFRVTRLVIAGNAVSAPLVEEFDRARAAGRPYDVSSVAMVMSSGMVWTDDSKAGLLRHLDALLFDIVGASEGGPFAYSRVRAPADLPSRLVLADGAAVLDGAGRELDPESGGTGVLAYRGAMPLGYLDDPARTAEVYREIGGRRYVVPGDYVRLLGGGRIEFLGRGSAVVNTGGEKVYPAEVEQEILAHDAVADCVVLAAPDERWGQVVAAVVEPRPGARLDPDALAAFLGERLAGYKKPRRIVVHPIERSPSGKANLRRLAALVAESGSSR